MESKFEEGERILIVLNTGENFEGDYFGGSATRIEIENVLHYESGNKFESLLTFYKGEISKVLRITGRRKNGVTENGEHGNPAPNTDKILIPREEYERLQAMTEDYILIKTDDKLYFDSVEKLLNCDSIGVIAGSCDKGRNSRIPVLALSSWKQIYIFDLHNFRSKRFPSELANIFLSHYIQKVVFNGGALVDCLLHTYKIHMHNIYDVQISHLMLMKNITGKCKEDLPTIGLCLKEYFNFSSTFLTSSQEILKDSWEIQPIDVDKLKKISRLATYLISLKDHQMSLMLKEYHKAVQSYNNLFTKKTDYQLLEMTANQKCTKEIDDLIPSCLLSINSIKSVKYE